MGVHPAHLTGNCRRSSSADSSNPAFCAPLRSLEVAWREADSRGGEGYRRGRLPGGPSMVTNGSLRLLISAAPTTPTLGRYAVYLQSLGVKHVVRVCEPTYAALRMRGHGMELHDWSFEDGCAPPAEIVDKWLQLLDKVYGEPNKTENTEGDAIAVHCMAGLGRAPVLVALALIEWGMHPFEAVGTTRALRRGAINGRQMAFLKAYTPRTLAATKENISPPAKHSRRYCRKFGWMKSRTRDSPELLKLLPFGNTTAREEQKGKGVI